MALGNSFACLDIREVFGDQIIKITSVVSDVPDPGPIERFGSEREDRIREDPRTEIEPIGGDGSISQGVGGLPVERSLEPVYPGGLECSGGFKDGRMRIPIEDHQKSRG